VMSAINHEVAEVAVADQNVNHAAEPLRPVHPPAPPGGCTGPPPVDLLQRVTKRRITPRHSGTGPWMAWGMRVPLGVL
jgi:hypothetical protein